jgi:Xaa-Pro aminopeptidase
MEAAGLDGLVSSTLENNFYMSGVWNLGQELFIHDTEAYVVARGDDLTRPVMVTSVGDADLTVGAEVPVRDVLSYGRFFRDVREGAELTRDEEWVKATTMDREAYATACDALVAAVRLCGLDRGVIGVDERGPNRDLIAQLSAQLTEARFVPGAQLFRQIRMVKTVEELVRLREALRITEVAMRETVAAASPGVTERELYRIFEGAIVAGGGRPGFTLLRFGRGMALGQVPSGETRLGEGDFIWFDVGCTYRGYRSDIGRVFSVGEPGERLRTLFSAIRAGQDRAIELMTPGRLASEVFTEAVARVREAGIPHYRRHHVGHGIGVEYYDLPILAPESDHELEANMIFEVETPYYELGFGGAFIEDTVLVTPDGSKVLTTLSRDLVPGKAANNGGRADGR